jgi:predicted RNA-binding protein YlxR (DUF448 family)
VAPKAELRRIAISGDDRVVADPATTMPGRGAYVCGSACMEEAVRRRALGRAFRRSVSVPSDLVESIR